MASDQHLRLHTPQTMIRESRHTAMGLYGWPAAPGGLCTRVRRNAPDNRTMEPGKRTSTFFKGNF